MFYFEDNFLFNGFSKSRFKTTNIQIESENINNHSQKGAHCQKGKNVQNASVYQRYGTV
ncbi:MAG: hypothetical protein ACW96S_08705 [Promethearchaeota archaeon]|jgi:hypothetical protein